MLFAQAKSMHEAEKPQNGRRTPAFGQPDRILCKPAADPGYTDGREHGLCRVAAWAQSQLAHDAAYGGGLTASRLHDGERRLPVSGRPG